MTELATATRSVVVEREITHAPEKVWRALTQAPLLEDWLMKNDFQPVVGRKFNFRAAPMPHWDGVVDCEVLEVEPNRLLSYRWESLGLKTIVTWTLTPTNGGVLLRMEQSGFGSENESNYRGATYGWQRYFAQLEQVVTTLA